MTKGLTASLGGVLIGLTLWNGGSAALAADQPKRGGTAIAVLGTDPPGINPGTSAGIADVSIGCMVYQGLTEETYDGKVLPLLAKSWSISPDGKTYTFDLVKANWHDGKPFTSADVKYSLEEVSAKYSAVFSNSARHFDKVETPASDKVVITLKQPFQPFLISLACVLGSNILPKHIYEGTNPLQNPANTEKPIGTGPYKLAEWKHGDHVRMVRNKDYWEPGLPYLDEVVFKVIPQASARTQALLAREADYVLYYYFPAADFKTIAGNPKLKLTTAPTPPSIDYMVFNTTRKPYDDKRVRQALFMATDREYLLKYAWLDRGVVGTEPFTKKIGWASDPSIDFRKMYPFDVAKANALLDEAGVKRAADGTRFKVRFVLSSDDVDYISMAQALKTMWAAVGVDLQTEVVDRATSLKRVFVDHDYDVAVSGYGSFNEPALGLARIFTTAGIGKAYANASVYSNPKVDELFGKAETALTVDDRGKYYREVQKILADELPALPLRDKSLEDVVWVGLRDHLEEAHANSWRKAWISE